ncbi:hypothetical protein [Stutzerimonas kunmingensis]|uniref:hypothetical protein n=1 Tax=Stutzerimonas kunmingensis TaxID=1211807 RepID=UPI001F29ABE7|nr:hypothetical protein [Stutzerimonas kunmingensis]UIP32233.1 hypothetical protein LW136_19265 [Stutzerimonas kunmingensis]
MKANALPIICMCLLFSLALPAAQANDDPEHLIQSCKELVGIYAKRDEQHLLAGLVTSPSEALRAGYCRGVLDEYRRSSFCSQSDWHTQAARIADYPAFAEELPSVETLLKQSCAF